jgi:hypothetical protein
MPAISSVAEFLNDRSSRHIGCRFHQPRRFTKRSCDHADNVKTPLMVDLRNIYRPSQMADAGFRYVSVGRPTAVR